MSARLFRLEKAALNRYTYTLMFDKPTSGHTIGLEIDGNLLKAALLSLQKGRPKLDQLFETPTSEASKNSFLLEKSEKYLSVTQLPSDAVLIRPLEIKLKKIKDIDAVLAFQAEPLLPYPLDQAVLERILISKESDSAQLSLLAVRKDHIQQHLEQWNNLQINPEVVSTESVALAFFSHHFTQVQEAHFVIHIASSHTTCVLLKEKKVLAAQSYPLGISALTQALEQDDVSKNMAEIDFTSLSTKNYPALFSVCEEWRREILRILLALAKLRREQEVTFILITGEGALYPSLNQFLTSALEKQRLELLTDSGFTAEPSEIHRFAIPIGGALAALSTNKEPINFRKMEYAYPDPWKRLKKPLTLYFLLSILLAFALFLFGGAYVRYQEGNLRQQYVNLLTLINQPYESFEREFMRKGNVKAGEASEAPVIALSALSQEDIKERLLYLQKKIKSAPELFPLAPQVPRVSDVLAWLSTHPNIATNKQEEGILIESFHYTMLKRPEFKKKNEKYQVKVELEFTSPTPKQAREFHDALIAPNEIVDPKGEIKWNSNKGKYQTSFFLKDKTSYTQ